MPLPTILVVEDERAHNRLIEFHLQLAGVKNPITKLTNGQEVVDLLFSEGSFKGKQRPDPVVVLLDLRMPQMDGVQVLHKVKGDERTRSIPVIILTTSDDQGEINQCYAAGCNLYVVKPVDYDAFARTIRQIGEIVNVMSWPEAGLIQPSV